MAPKNRTHIIAAIVLGYALVVTSSFVPLFFLIQITLSLIITAVFMAFYIMGYQHVLRRVLVGAPFLPSSNKAVRTMLELADVKPRQKVVDLGSGTGKIVAAFAKKGAVVTGYELNPLLFLLSKLKTRKFKNAHIKRQSFWDADLSKYDVITLFGIEYIMEMVEKKLLEEAKPGTKVISNIFPLPNTEHTVKKGWVYLYKWSKR